MKRHMLTLALCLLAVYTTAQTAKNKIKSIDITIETPTAGMTQQDGEQIKLQSVKTEYGDLVSMGLVTLLEAEWMGEFDRTNEEYPKFKPGFTYDCTLSLIINTEGKYICNHIVQKDGYTVNNNLVKSTVNGKQSLTMDCTPYCPKIKFYYTVPGEKSKEGFKEAKQTFDDERTECRHTSRAITTEQADKEWVGKQGLDVVVFNKANKPEGGYESSAVASYGEMFPGQKSVFITKLILDLDPEDCYGDRDAADYFASALTNTISGPYNLKEVWLSDKINALDFVKALNNSIKDPLFPTAREYCTNSIMFYSAEATLCVPENQIGPIRALLAKDPTEPVYTIRTYKGDVYTAQKAGLSATSEWCTKHQFTVVMEAADRIARYATCSTPQSWYYSCAICGKCEHNPNHTVTDKFIPGGHDYSLDLATDEAYLGVNASGYHVYSKSCGWCKHSGKYNNAHISRGEWKATGVEGTYEDYCKRMKETYKLMTAQGLMESTPQAGNFALPLRTTAKTSSPQMQSDANQALNDNIADTTLLGNDYTRPLTQEYLKSIAVRLAENLIGSNVKQSDINSFAVINGGAATPTRQELATVIYRTLRYVEKHSKYTYTDYTSRLSKYTDNSQIKDWAREPMAFMEALELIDPVTPTTLAPDQPCTIEQALSLAERSTLAHRIGWYQAVSLESSKSGFISVGSGKNFYYLMPADGTDTGRSLAISDRVWIRRPQLGNSGWLPSVDSYSGQTLYLKEEWYNPIRWRAGKISPDTELSRSTDRIEAISSAVNAPSSTKTTSKAATVADKAKKGINKIKKGLGGLLKNL